MQHGDAEHQAGQHQRRHEKHRDRLTAGKAAEHQGERIFAYQVKAQRIAIELPGGCEVARRDERHNLM